MTRPNPHKVAKPHNTQPRSPTEQSKMPVPPMQRDPGRPALNKSSAPRARGSQSRDFR
jgi:hypothetical protein